MALQFTRSTGPAAFVGQALLPVLVGDREIEPDRQDCLSYLEE